MSLIKVSQVSWEFLFGLNNVNWAVAGQLHQQRKYKYSKQWLLVTINNVIDSGPKENANTIYIKKILRQRNVSFK